VGVNYANGQLPLPNGAYGYVYPNFGVGATYVPGLSPVVEEWSASKSPYYTIGEPVLRKGLVYQLNYAWDGSTVGPPESQVDGSGNRVWSLSLGGAYVEQVFYNYRMKEFYNGPTKQWGLRPCHTLFYELFNSPSSPTYPDSIFNASMQKDPLPKAYYPGSEGLSVNVGAALNIPANLFKFVITDGASHPSSNVGDLVGGIFDYLKDYPYLPNGDPLGPLYHSESFSYTLTTDNWWMIPEYTEPSPLPTQTFTYTDKTGATINRSRQMWMIFIPETFLGRTYHGAFRVYEKHDNPNVLIERFELDSVTPDLNTD
jgi:hypothetical protein